MSLPVIIIVILVGLLLAVLEIVALPGGVAGICGGILTIVGISLFYSNYGTTAGNISLMASIAVGIGLLVFFMKSRTWKKASLNEQISSKANPLDKIAVGDEGVTVARLAPAGNAMINGEIVEVHSLTEFLDPNQKIRVVNIEGYRVDVEAIE